MKWLQGNRGWITSPRKVSLTEGRVKKTEYPSFDASHSRTTENWEISLPYGASVFVCQVTGLMLVNWVCMFFCFLEVPQYSAMGTFGGIRLSRFMQQMFLIEVCWGSFWNGTPINRRGCSWNVKRTYGNMVLWLRVFSSNTVPTLVWCPKTHDGWTSHQLKSLPDAAHFLSFWSPLQVLCLYRPNQEPILVGCDPSLI